MPVWTNWRSRSGLSRLLALLSFVPAVVILYVFCAAKWSPLDKITVHTPHLIRRTVSSTIIESYPRYSNLAAMQRAALVDPTNHLAWERICENFEGQSRNQNYQACQHAIALRDSETAERTLGDLDLEQGKACLALSEYQKAVELDKQNGSNGRYPLAASADAAAQCEGHLQTAKDAYQQVLALDEASLHDQMISGAADTQTYPNRTNISLDHCGLSLVYDKMEDADGSKRECDLAYPGPKKSCVASINESKQLQCDIAN